MCSGAPAAATEAPAAAAMLRQKRIQKRKYTDSLETRTPPKANKVFLIQISPFDITMQNVIKQAC